MLSDEEIVLKKLKETLYELKDKNVYVLKDKNVIGSLDFQIRDMVEDCIRVIEKLQKEIEELKEKNNKLMEELDLTTVYISGVYDGEKKVEDKIKAKIEEYKWAVESYDCDEADYKQSQAVGAWNVLQSLLEKE